MKRVLFFLAFCLFSVNCFCQEENDDTNIETEVDSDINTDFQTNDTIEDINPKTGFPEIKDKPFLMFNEGPAFSIIKRTVSQKDYKRSDFVWRDFQIGAYCEMQTGNMKPFNSIVRVAVYYPFKHNFNGMEQFSKQVLLYDFDVFAGILFQTDMWKYVRFNLAVGPHFDYQLSDEFHHLEFGVGGLLGVELPLHKKWTILVNGLMSFDNGNLGSNRKIMPYDSVWQYQIELGVRYSKKGINEYCYIKQK